ncbi:hypothetical protein [Pengzhenrongella sp.]|uniref:hypothetical protein n=1 Tax=Pengzhenrongella sp. TaxID=2888820 RepID=UPI002F943E62
MSGTFTNLDASAPATVPADTVRPARWPVLGATACAAVSAAILVLAILGNERTSLGLTGFGYLAGSIGVSLLVVVHRMRKQQAEQSLWFEPRPGLAAAARVVLWFGLLVGLGNAFFLATEIAKR